MRPPYLVAARAEQYQGTVQTRPAYSRAAALLLSASILLLSVSSVVYLTGNSSGASIMEEEAAQVDFLGCLLVHCRILLIYSTCLILVTANI